MKQEGQFYEQSQNDRKLSVSKSLISRQIFGQQNRKKRRMHSNSILNELRLNQKINQDNYLLKQQKSLKRFQTLRNNSINSRKRMSDFNFNIDQLYQPTPIRLSNFCQSTSKHLVPGQLFSNFSQLKNNTENNNHTDKINKLNEQEKQNKLSKQDKKFVIHKKKNKKNKQPKNLILSSINNKIRQIDIISRTFDKVNQFYAIDNQTPHQNYNHQISQTSKILKDFQSKLAVRKNMITQRKTSIKKNTKLQYRYKVMPKRYQTQASDIQNCNKRHKILKQPDKYQGIWHQDAQKIKNYISGGYSDQKEQYSDYYNIQQYRSLKKNFKIFQQIYNSIKQDKDNPIGKVTKTQFKRPNILQIVSVMEKQQQIDGLKLI